MRSILWLVACAAAELAAQDMAPFQAFNARRVQLTQRATWVLGGWAAANLGAGAVVSSGAERGSEAWHFGNMTMGWSAVNLGIAVPGLLSLRKEARSPSDITGTFNAQRRTEALYLINTGLDLGYMGLGLWMQERGLRTGGADGARLRGFGNAVIVQGAFLLAYDLMAYVAHSRALVAQPGGVVQAASVQRGLAELFFLTGANFPAWTAADSCEAPAMRAAPSPCCLPLPHWKAALPRKARPSPPRMGCWTSR